MSREFSIDVGSNPEYEDLVAELYYEGESLALISQDSGVESLDIEIQPRRSGTTWIFKVGDLENALRRTKGRRLELQREGGSD